MTAEEVVDADVVHEPGTDLVQHEQAPPPALFKTDDPVEVITKAGEVANALRDVLRAQGLTQAIQGKDHVKVEGWQLVGAMLGVTAICTHTEQVDGGFKATVEARMADGRVIGRADAVCTKHEKRGPWKTADDYARLSMAQTRATSKALKGPLGFVVSLAGYQTTPAEEMTHVAADEALRAASPAFAPADTAAAAKHLLSLIRHGKDIGAYAADWLTERFEEVGAPVPPTPAVVKALDPQQLTVLTDYVAGVVRAKEARRAS